MMKLHLSITACTLLALASAAHAQSSSAQAEQLFRDGKDAMKKGDYEEACKAFEGSDKLDPAVTTKMNLADCREKNNQIATAWGLYLEVVRETRDVKKQKALMKRAKERAADLEGRLSYLIINVRDEAKIDGLEIAMNGQPVDPLTWNTSLPVDGGDYTIDGKAPGYETWSTSVQVAAEKDKQSVDVPKFRGVQVEPPPPPPDDRVEHPVAPPARVDHGSSGMSGKRKASLGLGVLGIGGVVAAVVFELGAESTYDDAKAEPDLARRTDLTDQSNLKRGIAIGAGAVGVVALGLGAYLWISGGGHAAGEADHAMILVPTIGSDGVGFALTGRM
jgi:hypothetical protein